MGNDRAAPGDMSRVAWIVAGGREVKEVFETLGGIRVEGDLARARGPVSEHWHGSLWDLEEHVEFLSGTGGIGDHDLGPVDHSGYELIGDELVNLLAVLDAVAVSMAEVALADQKGRPIVGQLGLLYLTVEGNGAVGGGKDEAWSLNIRFAFR